MFRVSVGYQFIVIVMDSLTLVTIVINYMHGLVRVNEIAVHLCTGMVRVTFQGELYSCSS